MIQYFILNIYSMYAYKYIKKGLEPCSNPLQLSFQELALISTAKKQHDEV